MSESFAAGLVGIVLDERYRLDALLGEGGMGAVFRAHHLAMDRKVAVKLLKPHLTSDDHALQRFVREARSTMKVDSDHAVKVLDFGITPRREYYMVLEYLDGRTVQRELDVDGPFAPARVIHIARQSLRALGAAHDAGLVHRDIKPENILLMRSGDDPDYTKVLDFGVAKLMEGAAKSSKSQLALTAAGMVFGTPEFMSPEQACGQALDGRSDLYSLAATMFAMLTGCAMFKASAPIEWLSHHARTPPPHLSEGLPALAPYTALDQMLHRCLAKRRDDRPRNAAAMIAMLDEVERTIAHSGTPAVEPSATLDMRSHADAATPGPSPSALARLPRQTDTVSAFTASISSDLLGPTTGVTSAASGRRGLWLVLGAAAVVAMIVAAVVVATRKKSSRAATIVAKGESRGVNADAAPEGADLASSPSDASIAIAIDATRIDAPPPPADAGVRRPSDKKAASTDPAVASHIAAAEQAKRAGNRLRQLAEADAALHADPRNVRARLLFADALIASGDLDRGCKHLRDLKKNPTARELARQARCPSN